MHDSPDDTGDSNGLGISISYVEPEFPDFNDVTLSNFDSMLRDANEEVSPADDTNEGGVGEACRPSFASSSTPSSTPSQLLRSPFIQTLGNALGELNSHGIQGHSPTVALPGSTANRASVDDLGRNQADEGALARSHTADLSQVEDGESIDRHADSTSHGRASPILDLADMITRHAFDTGVSKAKATEDPTMVDLRQTAYENDFLPTSIPVASTAGKCRRSQGGPIKSSRQKGDEYRAREGKRRRYMKAFIQELNFSAETAKNEDYSMEEKAQAWDEAMLSLAHLRHLLKFIDLTQSRWIGPLLLWQGEEDAFAPYHDKEYWPVDMTTQQRDANSRQLAKRARKNQTASIGNGKGPLHESYSEEDSGSEVGNDRIACSRTPLADIASEDESDRGDARLGKRGRKQDVRKGKDNGKKRKPADARL